MNDRRTPEPVDIQPGDARDLFTDDAARVNNEPSAAFLVVETGEQTGLMLPIGGRNIVIGRSSRCELALKNAGGVSRQHAVIDYGGGDSYTVRDNGSRNGVRVNGTKIPGPTPLKDGDVIQLSSERIRFVLPSLDDSISMPSAPSGSNANPFLEPTKDDDDENGLKSIEAALAANAEVSGPAGASPLVDFQQPPTLRERLAPPAHTAPQSSDSGLGDPTPHALFAVDISDFSDRSGSEVFSSLPNTSPMRAAIATTSGPTPTATPLPSPLLAPPPSTQSGASRERPKPRLSVPLMVAGGLFGLCLTTGVGLLLDHTMAEGRLLSSLIVLVDKN